MSKIVSILSVAAVVALFLVLGGTLVSVTGLQPQVDPATPSNPGTAFTYQGYLTQSQEPANGSYDLVFSLYDDPEAGAQVGTTLSSTVTISDGLFTVELDFGSVFDGTPLWLEVGVRPAGQVEPFTPLLPRQHLTPAPFSVFATLAASAPWAGLTDVPADFSDNVDNDRLADLSCAPGQIPEWNGATWTCGEDNVGTGSGGGDITAVQAGYGLGGGSESGDARLYVLTETIQARVAEICPPGSSIQAINQDGSVACETDDDTTYSAGNQITLFGTTFDVVEGAGSGLDADLLDGLHGDYYRSWSNLTGVPTGLDDGDNDTTYSAGNQITLTGTTFDLVEGAGSGLDADLLDGQDGDYYRAWGSLTDVPAGLDDGDDDTLSGLICSDDQLLKWDETGGQWTCAGDLDTTYQPGAGLTLSDTTFAISTTYQLPQTCGPSQTVKWNGSTWACATDELGAGGSAWLLAGNASTSPITDFLGTTDNQALEFRVNGSRALRLEPHEASPNILGGYAGNRVDAGVVGAVIGGGGRDLAINQANDDYSIVVGGAANTAGGYASAVGGGAGNSASGSYSTAAGGSTNSANGSYAAVGGGQANTVTGTHTTVAGGGFNQTSAPYATVGGGASNVVSGTFSTISGGQSNEVTGAHASVGGGGYNRVAGAYSTIAGGGPSDTGNPTTSNNRVFDDYGTIGGGGGNVAGRGDDGDATAQAYATVGGGEGNTAEGDHATVGGGEGNTAGSYGATVGGGLGNSSDGNYATIAGGSTNIVTATYGTVGGGRLNEATGTYATVGGGYGNEISAGIGTIGGGYGNVVTATYGAIPGGMQNYVGGQYGLAAGRLARAEHAGTFVWSDSSSTAFASTGPDQFLISAAGGVGIGTNAPSHLLTVDGSAAIQSSDLISVGAIVAYTMTLQMPRSLYAVGDLLYAAGYATNTLSIWDVTDPPDHALIGYTTFQLSGPMDLQVVGNRAYLASQNSNMLTVLDVSDPSNPSHVGDTTKSLGRPQGVHVSGKYVYVASKGREKPAGLYDGLTVIDVSDAPAEMAATSFITTYLQGTSDVFVTDNYAYVTSRDNHRMVVFDVSDPRHPTAVSYTEASLVAPVRVHVSGIYAYVVDEEANRVVAFDISNPAQIAYLGHITTNLSHPRSIYVSGDRAYVAYAGDAGTNENCGLAVLDLSDPADIAVLNVIDMSDWLRPIRQEGEWVLVPPKPVAVTGSGDRIYVANERHDSVTIFEIDSLEASAVRAGELQVAQLEVADYAAIEGDLGVRGGLNVGPGGALVQGALTVEGMGDSYIQGRLGIGPAATVITRSVSPTEYVEIVLPHPTHDLDVDGEARFRVSDRNHLVLRSPNTATGDDSAYIDFVELTYPDELTPSARIAFLTVDPLIPARTGLYFYTRGADDAKAVSRLEIEPEGDVRPGEDSKYSLGTESSRWKEVWADGFPTTSDARRKENVSPLPFGLAEVSALRPVVFSWIYDAEQRPHYGLIAQEVREVLPEIVSGHEEEGSLSMSYDELVPVLVKAVQEQQAEIDTQAEQIAALEARLAALEGGQTGQPRVVNPLTTLGFGGLVLGAVTFVGLRRKGGRP